jgi:hypothetical protein
MTAPAYAAAYDIQVNDSAAVSSQQVSWWSVHEYVAAVLERVGRWPLIGSPEWVDLPDDDPAKIAAIFDAARHWALRLETGQQAQCEASRGVSAAAGWSGIANEIFYRRAGGYIPREVA